MQKKKATFYIAEEVLNELKPYKFYKSLLVETAVEILMEHLSREQLFEILFLSDGEDEEKKKRIKELLKLRGSTEEKVNPPSQKNNMLERFKDFID